jgi:hypothetical protein
MPARSKGARLWLRRARRDRKTGESHNAVWIIRDGKRTEGTGCRKDDRAGAERALAEYLNRKHLAQASKGPRDPSQVPIADVLALYGKAKVASQSRPKETAGRIERLLGFFGDKTLCELNGDLCRAYVDRRSTDAAARRELEDLRAAINYHRREGLCSQIVAITLPDERPPRERWLTRKEAAGLVRAAWRYREVQKGVKTDRRSRRHVAKFILMGLYTGTRSGAICGAALHPTVGGGWIDVDRGVFYRRPAGRRETNKRQPPVPVPGQLLAHLRRWKTRGQRYAVEWNGKPVKSDRKGVRSRCRRCRSRTRRDAARPQTHVGDVANAERNQSLGGRRISRHDGRNAAGAVWSPSSGSPVRSPQSILEAPRSCGRSCGRKAMRIC